MNGTKEYIAEIASNARERLSAELLPILKNIILEAATKGDDSALVTFTNNCSRYGHVQSWIISITLDRLRHEGYGIEIYLKGGLSYGEVVYTIHSDGAYTSAPSRVGKDYIDLIEITW